MVLYYANFLDRVTFAGLTWDQSEFENLSINLINAESRFAVIEDLKKLFSISDLFLVQIPL